MTPKELTVIKKWCWEHFVFINPLPVSKNHTGKYKIEITIRGEAVVGHGIYHDNPPKGQPSIWDKINDLYQQIFNENNAKM
jgi:hypothetical protein